ncbi:hypothetical protein K1719_038055 [Acacia pycnantha]|nr:hypothetical protein K1719_038055 [Acacia pycnantha]
MSVMFSDKKTNLKYFCKICKKGFGTGRALGGHMRAHGIGDESSAMDDDDEDPASDWEDRKLEGDANDNIDPSNKRMYPLRANPNRLKSCRAWENCGKEFSGLKSILEHPRCSSDNARDESFVSPGSEGDDTSGGRGCSLSKRKRSLRPKLGISFNNNNPNCSSPNEDEDLANCLMMLSNEARESSTLASKEEEGRNTNFSLMAPMSSDHINKGKEIVDNNNNKSLFECKACKKVFNSHQALGGHRASHKKVKGCFATRLHNIDEASTGIADDDATITQEDPLFPTKHNSNNNNSTLHLDHDSNNNNALSSKRKSKVHECSICHRIFSSGQALGGHKRCHWITSTAPDTSTLVRFQQFQDQIEEHMKYNNPVISDDNKFVDSHDDPIHLKLDLNLPAPSTARNVFAEMYLQSLVSGGGKVPKQHEDEDDKSQSHQNHENENNDDEEEKKSNRNVNISKDSTMQKVVEDEETNSSKVKLAKLSEDDVGGSSLPWLQVGIVPTNTTDVGNGP